MLASLFLLKILYYFQLLIKKNPLMFDSIALLFSSEMLRKPLTLTVTYILVSNIPVNLIRISIIFIYDST